MKGMMVSLEGFDGAGKSSQMSTIKNVLQAHGFNVITTREPGGTPIAEKIRNLLLNEKMCPMSELLMFAASRADHVETLIKPSLDEGKIVVSDRFSDSSYSYQGSARGLKKEVLELEQFVLNGFEPDYTLFFDVSFEVSVERLAKRNDNNAFDNETYLFKKAVFEGYQERFLQNPHRMVRIDANQSLENVTRQVTDWLINVFIPSQTK